MRLFKRLVATASCCISSVSVLLQSSKSVRQISAKLIKKSWLLSFYVQYGYLYLYIFFAPAPFTYPSPPALLAPPPRVVLPPPTLTSVLGWKIKPPPKELASITFAIAASAGVRNSGVISESGIAAMAAASARSTSSSLFFILRLSPESVASTEASPPLPPDGCGVRSLALGIFRLVDGSRVDGGF